MYFLIIPDDIDISQYPQSVTLATGNMLTLNVTASGPGNITYQWKKRGKTLSSDKANEERTSSLKIRSVTSSDSGSYYCVVMNQWGNMMESNDATVTVWRKLIILKCK